MPTSNQKYSNLATVLYQFGKFLLYIYNHVSGHGHGTKHLNISCLIYILCVYRIIPNFMSQQQNLHNAAPLEEKVLYRTLKGCFPVYLEPLKGSIQNPFLRVE